MQPRLISLKCVWVLFAARGSVHWLQVLNLFRVTSQHFSLSIFRIIFINWLVALHLQKAFRNTSALRTLNQISLQMIVWVYQLVIASTQTLLALRNKNLLINFFLLRSCWIINPVAPTIVIVHLRLQGMLLLILIFVTRIWNIFQQALLKRSGRQ